MTEDYSADLAIDEEAALLARLYVLGEKYHDDKFKNAIIDTIIAVAQPSVHEVKTRWFLTGPEIDIIYRGTCKGSPIRKLMVDMHFQAGKKEWITESSINNKDFLEELCAHLLQKIDGAAEVKKVSFLNCLYHTHEDGEICEDAGE